MSCSIYWQANKSLNKTQASIFKNIDFLISSPFSNSLALFKVNFRKIILKWICKFTVYLTYETQIYMTHPHFPFIYLSPRQHFLIYMSPWQHFLIYIFWWHHCNLHVSMTTLCSWHVSVTILTSSWSVSGSISLNLSSNLWLFLWAGGLNSDDFLHISKLEKIIKM